ncbi:hypothetical protein Rsub_06087 [Raphidocelis subcapitata]|uniref:Protein-serine/threonine kinase n=1 Tax=Raphidocelis subcapitata TaxID=307507 RepID=A0A2V0P9I4_9CHLO|nr:hypothetical protein Rsub_06087 [Raphidocelis subcapitata]|eukprot:GBF93755.1 hypothetical protein Rsub_06087 [Raphidocelis subcapitata]
MMQIAPGVLARCLGPLGQRAAAATRRALSYIPEPDDTPLYNEQLCAPNRVQQVNVVQLDKLVRQASLPRLVDSAAFLTSQLPARLENHVSRLQALLPSCGAELSDLLSASAESKSGVLEVSRDWGLLDRASPEGLRHFESHLAGFKERVEGEFTRLMTGARQLAGQPGWWQRDGDVAALNQALDLTHWYVLGLRLMLTQHSAALHALDSSSKAAAAAAHPPDHRGPATSGGFLEPPRPGHAPPPPSSMIERAAPLRQVLQHVSEDVRAFCVEKNSAAPEVEIVGGEGLRLPLVAPYFEFMVSEILKNATQAVVTRFGAWDVDEADPVRIQISEPADDPNNVLVSITDRGLGVPADHFRGMFFWFWSSNKPLLGGYGYSRTHGSPMHGLGAGVPVSRVLAHFMGGQASWETSSFHLHTTVEIRLPKQGFVF